MKLLRDFFDLPALRRRLLAGRVAKSRSYVVTVPAPLSRASSVVSLHQPANDAIAATPASSGPAMLKAAVG